MSVLYVIPGGCYFEENVRFFHSFSLSASVCVRVCERVCVCVYVLYLDSNDFQYTQVNNNEDTAKHPLTIYAQLIL